MCGGAVRVRVGLRANGVLKLGVVRPCRSHYLFFVFSTLLVYTDPSYLYNDRTIRRKEIYDSDIFPFSLFLSVNIRGAPLLYSFTLPLLLLQ